MSRNFRAYLIPSEHRRLNEFIGLLLATLAVLVGLSLISFNPDDPSLNISRNPSFDGKPANFIGALGAYVADAFLQMLGRPVRVAADESGSTGTPVVVPALMVRDFNLASVSDAI